MRPVRPVAQFALTGLAAVLLLGFVGVAALRKVGTREAIRDARQETRLAAAAVIQPSLPRDLAHASAPELARFDRVVRRSVLVDPVVRVKVWSADGTVVYSDAARLIGEHYRLDGEELEALREGGSDAEVTDLSKPENRFEARGRKLLEVYQGVRAPGGERLLFETYRRYTSISASSRRLWQSFLPALLAALVVLWLVQVPLAWSLARRLERGRVERERLLHRALEASDEERRRIAADLHDGVVQDLVGTSLGLAGREPDAADTLRRAVRDLRALLVDIYPPQLESLGLEAAVRDLLDGLGAEGMTTRLEVEDDLPALSDDVRRLLYRGTQEGLRNVRKHARASAVEVSLCARPRGAVGLVIEDDGVGYDADAGTNGHMGLRILSDLARDAGGSFTIARRAGGAGTRMALEVPAR